MIEARTQCERYCSSFRKMQGGQPIS